MADTRKTLGRQAEESACRFLEQAGMRVVARNYKTPSAEIDIIARDNDCYCFIEVKARSSDRFGLPQEAVGVRKQRKIIQAARYFLKGRRLEDARCRFDVVSVMAQDAKLECSLITNAFEANE